MSIRTKFSCPYCRLTFSDYSKKGFKSLHTSIGIPFMNCSNCQKSISTGHQPFQNMSNFMKSFEILKISLNILIATLLGGMLFGMILGGLFSYLMNLENDSFFYCVIFGLLSFLALVVLHMNSYIKWSKFVSKHIDENGDSILSNLYKHPDW